VRGDVEAFEPLVARYERVLFNLALRMVGTLCGDNPARWAIARRAVLDALAARTRMWDGIVAHLPDDDLAVA